jgi:hypothetical protein
MKDRERERERERKKSAFKQCYSFGSWSAQLERNISCKKSFVVTSFVMRTFALEA